jgi:hypothetical protein
MAAARPNENRRRAEQKASQRARRGITRVRHAWMALEPDQRWVAIAAIGLLVTMLLPWYSKSYTVVVKGSAKIASTSLSAFQDFSFVEAAVLLVSAGVLTILFARAERRAFRLPGGDGSIIMLAGAWSAILIFYRLLSKPSTAATQKISTTIGIQWGIFLALACAGLLAYAGSRIRALERPEPPLIRDPAERFHGGQRNDPSSQQTVDLITSRSSGEDQLSPVPARQRSRYPPQPSKQPPASEPRPRRASPSTPGSEQLSFEDPT